MLRRVAGAVRWSSLCVLSGTALRYVARTQRWYAREGIQKYIPIKYQAAPGFKTAHCTPTQASPAFLFSGVLLQPRVSTAHDIRPLTNIDQ
jgi:hypothetical protein